MCRMCGKAPEYVAHVLAGCSSLAQTKYLERHNAAQVVQKLVDSCLCLHGSHF